MNYEIVTLTGSAELLKLSMHARDAGLEARRLEHELDWLRSDSHGTGTTGAALAIYHDGVLTAYLPFLHRRQYRLQLLLGELQLASIPFSILQLFGNLIVAKDENVVAPALAALKTVPFPYCAITVEETPINCVGWQILQGMTPSEFLKSERECTTHHIVRLPSTFADYLAQFSKKSRYNMARRTRLLSDVTGPLTLIVFSRSDEVLPILHMIEPLVRRTYHYRMLGKDLTPSNRVLVESLQRWAELGWLRGYVLMGANGPLAYTVGYLVRRGYFYEMPGYDPDFADHSPGNELLTRLIEDLIQTQTADFVDFGAGDAKYKQYFGNHAYTEISAILVRRHPYALLAIALERTLALCSRLIGQLLDRWKLKAQLKNFLRRKAGKPA